MSLLSVQDMLLGRRIAVLSAGEFTAPFRITLPRRSVLVLSGNAADVAKHCVPSVTQTRISLTFRIMPDWARRAVRQRQGHKRAA